MNVDELQSVQSRERQTDSLQQLRPTFYEDAAAFVQDLREERRQAAEQADDPFDEPDVNRLTDDIRTAEQTIEAIYERRVGKVVKMASLTAADMPTEREGLTKEEQDLFETLVGAIEDHHDRLLDVLGGDAPPGAVAAPPAGEDRDSQEAAVAAEPDDPNRIDAADVMGGEDAPDTASTEDAPDRTPAEDAKEASDGRDQATGDGEARGTSGEGDSSPPSDTDTGEATMDEERSGDEAADADGSDDEAPAEAPAGNERTDRVTVRITEDVGEIFGVDEREYDLATDDVVTLPATNAEPLIERDAAEPLE